MYSWNGKTPATQEFFITEQDINRISSIYQLQFGVLPSKMQLGKLIENHIREEIYWREGLALGLDTGDEIVRRRIAQKFSFLQESLLTPVPPEEKQLEQYYQANRDRYVEPGRVSFTHIYFESDTATQRLTQIKAQLKAATEKAAIGLGQHFPGQNRFSDVSATELTRIFGRSPFVKTATDAPIGRWSGPIQSGFGNHFIFVTDRIEGQLPELHDMREKVLADYLADRRDILNANAYTRLRNKYQVFIEAPL